MITETAEIAAGLDLAARIWPDDQSERATLLRHIIEAGIESCEQQLTQRKTKRQNAIMAIQEFAKRNENLWPANWNEIRLAEWPE